MDEQTELRGDVKTFFAIYIRDKDGKTQTCTSLLKADSMQEENGILRVYRSGALVGLFDLGVLQTAQLKEGEG